MKDKLNAFLPIIQLFGFADNRQEKASVLAANKNDLGASEESGIHTFLKYVPANTSLMYVSTHVINLICRLAKIYLERSDKATSKSKRDLENHSVQALHKCYAAIHF